MDSQAKILYLSNRSFLYALAARAYAEEIDQTFIEIFASEHAQHHVELMADDLDESILPLFVNLVEKISREDARAEISHEYVRLFVGPGTLKVSPWETVFLTKSRSLFQPKVLEIRNSYQEAGFLPIRYQNIPDDFIGIEIDFLAKLAIKAQELWFEEHINEASQVLKHSIKFLEDHLLNWIGLFADSIEEKYSDGFYAEFTHFVYLIAKRDRDLLNVKFQIV